MLDTFVIGLREGLEAALIVSILVAYLVKLNRKNDVPTVFVGVTIAIVLSIAVALGLNFIEEEAGESLEKILSGAFSLLAAVFVTWMIFWMARQSRTMGSELRAKIDVSTSTLSLAAVAAFAVLREGIETAVFIWAAARTASSATYDPALSVTGAVLGLLFATVLGYLIYRGAVKLNLTTFFKWTGAFLILVAAGIAAYGVHELQEVGLLPFLTANTYDLSEWFPKYSIQEVLLSGTVAFRAAPSQLETLVWVAFVLPVSYLYAKQYSKNN
jgi:high-affinity iron transporter